MLQRSPAPPHLSSSIADSGPGEEDINQTDGERRGNVLVWTSGSTCLPVYTSIVSIVSRSPPHCLCKLCADEVFKVSRPELGEISSASSRVAQLLPTKIIMTSPGLQRSSKC